MKENYVVITSRKLAIEVKQEADSQGLEVCDIVEKALGIYLATQAAKKIDNRYLLWHVPRKGPKREEKISSQSGIL